MQDYSIERLGIPNLDFTGELIGQSYGQIPKIKIYKTNGGKFVGQQEANQQLSRAEHFDSAPLLIDWFKATDGCITPEVESAIEDAANHDNSFRTAWNVRVD
jgi:hypothetical protein